MKREGEKERNVGQKSVQAKDERNGDIKRKREKQTMTFILLFYYFIFNILLFQYIKMLSFFSLFYCFC